MSSCNVEVANAVKESGVGMPMAAYIQFEEKMHAVVLDTATAAVLTERRGG